MEQLAARAFPLLGGDSASKQVSHLRLHDRLVAGAANHGALDPVGNKGRGVKSTAALFEKAGIKDVEVKLYQGMRHEILNEPGKQQVYDDVLAWIDRHIS